MEVPVYLFTGFLDSGKTGFIQETLCDKRFNVGERTLVILCEEGERELDISEYPCKNVYIETVDDEEDMSEELFESLRKKYRAERVIVEYNGMWNLQTFYDSLPDNWTVTQEITFADSTTVMSYNANMRNLVVDKLNGCELIVFNRVTKDTDKSELHKLVRGVSRRTDIAYEYTDGSIEYDDIEDPLPFDVNAEVIVIEDKDYALWYRDVMENLENYDGKKVHFKGIVADNKKFDSNMFVAGRHIMTCCVEDITYCGMICEYNGGEKPKTEDWVEIDAEMSVEYHKIYKQKGPVLKVSKIKPSTPPEQKVATFY